MKLGRLKKIQEAVKASREQMEVHRQNRLRRIKYYCGTHYTESGCPFETPYNLINIATNVIARLLAANNPKARIVSEMHDLQVSADNLKKGTNYVINEIDLKISLRKVIKEALLGVGIRKCGLNYSRTEEIGGILHDIGQPFCDAVNLQDYVIDMNAKKKEQCHFEGDKFILSLEQMKNSGLYDPDLVAKLQPTHIKYTDEDEPGEFEADLDGELSIDREDIVPMVQCQELWLPYDGLVIQYPINNTVDMVIREIEWQGPERGPYDILSFDDVPGQIIPCPPAAHWEDGHDIINTLLSKLREQARRQKKMVAVDDESVGEQVRDGEDGDVFVKGYGEASEVNVGGISQEILAFTVYNDDLMNKIVGNLAALAGWGPQADTAQQDQLITSGALRQLEDMEDRVRDFTTRSVKDIAYYLFYDPAVHIPITKTDPNGVISIPFNLTQDQIEGDFLEYNYTIEVHSMRPQPLSMKAAKLKELFGSLILPLMPMFQQQGKAVDLDYLVETLAEFEDLPELKRMLLDLDPSQVEQAMVPESGKSPVTQRNYTRRNIPGATDAGKKDVLMRALLGSGVQSSEGQSLMRPTG